MRNESGDLKLLGNFRKLIDLVSADTKYQPSNAGLKPPALYAQHTAALTSAQDVPAKLILNMAAISDRETAFADVNPRMTRVHGVAKASGAPKQVIDDLNTFKRKLISKRKAKAKPAAAVAATGATPSPAAEKERSSAQLSYDNMVGHLDGYFSALANVPSYNPNEADLKLSALQAFADNLRAKNDAVSSTFVPLSQARGLRDQLLYQADNSVVNTALLVKEYVKGAFGTQSQLYKQIKGLEFKRSKK
jgi:hypothetical protein